MLEDLNNVFYIATLYSAILHGNPINNILPIETYIKNESFADAIQSTKSVNNCRLRTDISVVKEMILENYVLKVERLPTLKQFIKD